MLTLILMVSGVAWAQPHGYAVNSRGDFDDDSRVFALWRIDLSSGEAGYVGDTGQGEFIDVEGLAFQAPDRLFGTDDNTNTLLRISIKTGNAVPIGGPQAISNMALSGNQSMDFGMTFTCEGDLLVSAAGPRQLFWADPQTGQLDLIGELDVPIVDLASIGSTIYGIGLGTDRNGNAVARNLYRIDPEKPKAILIGALGSGVAPYNQAGLAADENDVLWAITDRNSVPPSSNRLPSQILRIDTETGRAEHVADTIVGVESLAIAPPGACRAAQAAPAEVPLMSPPWIGLMALVMAVIAGFRLRHLAAS